MACAACSACAGRSGRAWAGAVAYGRRASRTKVSTPLASARHVVEANLDALRRIGIHPGVDERALTLVAGTAAEARIARLAGEHRLADHSFVQIHPSSRWRFKCWPAEKMAALIDRLHAEGLRVVLTAAPDNTEAQMIADIEGRIAQPVGGESRWPAIAEGAWQL
jgi:heptosyltransferase-3